MSLTTAKTLLRSIRITRGGLVVMCRKGSSLSQEEMDHSRTSNLNKDRELYLKKLQHNYKIDKESLDQMRQKFPDFLPNPDAELRDKMKEKLERLDMYRRRSKIQIPEFYVGSILAVTVSDIHSPGKNSRFLGICIHREGHGLHHSFTLRNVINKQGVEVTYDMYSPLLQQIEVIKLEKRLDDSLFYLRDCPLEYSTFNPQMEPDPTIEGGALKVNTIKIPLNPRPWHQRWERADLKGIQEIEYKNEVIKERLMKQKEHPQVKKEWEQEDIVKHYRETINPVEAGEILGEVKKKEDEKWR